MKKSYHSMVVPIALASATRRASAARCGTVVTMWRSSRTAGLGTNETGRVFDAAGSFVTRLFGIRAKRVCAAGPRRPVACGGDNAVRCSALFHSVHERGEGIKLIGCRAAATMIHSGNAKQPHEILRSAIVHPI